MNSLYGYQLRKDKKESFECKSQQWMEKEFDGIVLD